MARLQMALEGEAGVCLAYLFGSVARGDDGPTSRDGEAGLCPAEPERGKVWKPSQGFHISDVDVAVWTSEPVGLFEIGALAERLGAALGRRVDLVDLRAAPPLLCRQVVAEGELLLVRDPLFRFDFELEAVRRYEDTRPLRAQQQQLLKETARRGRAA